MPTDYPSSSHGRSSLLLLLLQCSCNATSVKVSEWHPSSIRVSRGCPSKCLCVGANGQRGVNILGAERSPINTAESERRRIIIAGNAGLFLFQIIPIHLIKKSGVCSVILGVLQINSSYTLLTAQRFTIISFLFTM